jgi:Sulfotransferase domain
LLKVIGAGYGRTGTQSLKLALETLGFAKCYHFTEMLRAWHVPVWLAVARGEPADWEAVFAGFQATTDWPAAAYYRELAAYYPEAKLVLTTRAPEDWYRSVRRTLYPLRRALPLWLPGFRAVARLADAVIWLGTFGGRFTDPAYAIAVYERHVADVRAAVAKDRLLIFDVREGWEPLCEFLGVPVPAGVEFPHANEARSIVRITRMLRAGVWLLAGLVVALGAGLLLALQAR